MVSTRPSCLAYPTSLHPAQALDRSLPKPSSKELWKRRSSRRPSFEGHGLCQWEHRYARTPNGVRCPQLRLGQSGWVTAREPQDASPQKPSEYLKLIQDARTIVRKLGFRYLWVDKYCINQEDASELHGRFGRMHQIYEGSSGNCGSCRIGRCRVWYTGSQRCPRWLQPRAYISGKWYVSTLSDVGTALRSSRWKTRGWTYQEFVLSWTCLLFTKSQVYFVCRGGTQCEAVGGSLGMVRGKEIDSGAISSVFLGRTREPPKWNSLGERLPKPKTEFWSQVEQYTARQLTYPSDALNAFRGALARAVYFNYWGVPIMITPCKSEYAANSDLNAGFAFGLAWHGAMDKTWWDGGHNGVGEQEPGSAMGSYSRCRDFPSWSWSGWKGARVLMQEDIAWDKELVNFNDFVKFWIDDGAEDLFSLLKVVPSKCLRESSHFIQLENTVVRLRITWNGTRYSVWHPDIWHAEPFFRPAATICRGYWAERPAASWPAGIEFEAILLYHCTRFIGSCTLLLIEQHETAYERVGLAWMNSDSFASLPATERRIRLG